MKWRRCSDKEQVTLFKKSYHIKLDLWLLHLLEVGWSQKKDRRIWFFLFIPVISSVKQIPIDFPDGITCMLSSETLHSSVYAWIILVWKHIMVSKLPEKCFLLKIYLLCWDISECSCAISHNFVWLLTIFKSVLDSKKKLLFHIIREEIVPKWMIQV